LWFLCQRLNGLLLYNGQNANGHGDFLSINLLARFPNRISTAHVHPPN
jgi:hypothetical protein